MLTFGQQAIAGYRILRQPCCRVDPLLDLFDDPGELRNGRISKTVRERARAGRLDLQITASFATVFAQPCVERRSVLPDMLPQVVVALIGVVLVGSALWDAFETVVLPHRVARRWRFARIYYRSTWLPYRALARRFKDGQRREAVLSYYGPLSLLQLVALWALILVLGFAALQWSAGSTLTSSDTHADFWTDLYFSGTTFFTLGLGDGGTMNNETDSSLAVLSTATSARDMASTIAGA